MCVSLPAGVCVCVRVCGCVCEYLLRDVFVAEKPTEAYHLIQYQGLKCFVNPEH